MAAQASAATTTVDTFSFGFNPSSITVAVGDTVHWTISSGFHNVAPNGGTEPAGNSPGSSWTYDYTFNNPGAFPYYCQVHGAAAMSGVVNVEPAPTATDTPSPSPTLTITETPTDVPVGSTVTDTPTFSPTATVSPTATPTRTVTATATPGSPGIQLFDHSPELILAPNPQQIGMPICLYSHSIPQESHWNVYNTLAERVASLDFSGPGLQCWDTSNVVPGLYYVDVKWTLANGGIKRVKQKVVLWR